MLLHVTLLCTEHCQCCWRWWHLRHHENSSHFLRKDRDLCVTTWPLLTQCESPHAISTLGKQGSKRDLVNRTDTIPTLTLRRAAGWRESREEKVGLALGQWRETLLDCDLRRQRDTESLRGFLWILENLGCEGVRDHLRGEPASLSVLPRPRQHASRRRGHASVWLTQKKRGAGTMLSRMWGPWHLLTGPSGFCLRQNKS